MFVFYIIHESDNSHVSSSSLFLPLLIVVECVESMKRDDRPSWKSESCDHVLCVLWGVWESERWICLLFPPALVCGAIYLLSSDQEEKETGNDTLVPCVWW